MLIGQLARRILGPRLFPLVGSVYRRIFVDLSKVVEAIGPLGDRVELLDIGGGDGVLLNLILERHPDLTVTLVDASSAAGRQLRPKFQPRVKILADTTLTEYAQTTPSPPDVVLVSDVVHHVLPSQRRSLFEAIASLLQGQHCRLFLKDMEPGYFRTFLGGLADRYVSGDDNVQFLSRQEAIELVRSVFPEATCEETNLFAADRPNYCLVFEIPNRAEKLTTS